jgi:hypothetical protein
VSVSLGKVAVNCKWLCSHFLQGRGPVSGEGLSVLITTSFRGFFGAIVVKGAIQDMAGAGSSGNVAGTEEGEEGCSTGFDACDMA